MSIQYATRWLPGVVVSLVGCADGARMRQHDALYAAVARATAERAHAQDLNDAALAVNGELDRAAVVARGARPQSRSRCGARDLARGGGSGPRGGGAR
jgi:hypothetical protein